MARATPLSGLGNYVSQDETIRGGQVFRLGGGSQLQRPGDRTVFSKAALSSNFMSIRIALLRSSPKLVLSGSPSISLNVRRPSPFLSARRNSALSSRFS